MAVMSFLRGISNVRHDFNSTLTILVLVLCTSQFSYGFDIATFSNLAAMPAFQKQFGEKNHKTGQYSLDPKWLSLFSSLQYLGLLFGVIIGSMVSRRYGRRWCVFSMCVGACGFATISITSRNRWQIVAGRTLNFIFIGMDMSVIPIFQAEITPAARRGLTVGTYQFIISFSQIVTNAVCRATGNMPSNAAWKIPLGLFFWPPAVVASAIWFLPESPRWLALQNRTEEAREALARLRAPRFSENDIDLEFQAIVDAIERERQQEKGNWKELFQGTNLRRTWLVVTCNCFLAGTGANFANLYGAYFIQQMHYINPFTVTLCSSIGITILSMLTMFAMDKVGRRIFPIAGAALLTSALITMAALGTIKPQTKGTMAGIIAMMQLCTAAYSAGWAPTVHVLSVELTSPRLRDLTYRLGNIIQVLIQFITGFTMPYLIWDTGANLQSKVGFVFGPIAFAGLLFSFFFIPECKGLTLEVVDRLFSERVSAKDFQRVGHQYVAELEERPRTGESVKDGGTIHLEIVAPAHSVQGP